MLPVAIANFPIGASPVDWQSANGLVACTPAAVMLCFQKTLHVDDLCGQCTKLAIKSRLSTQPRAMKVAYTGEALLHSRFVRFRLDTSGGQAVSLSAIYGWPKTPC